MITIIIAIAAIILSRKLVSKAVSALKLSAADEQTIKPGIMSTYSLVMFLMVLFGINVIWYNIAFFIDNLRTPSGTLSFIGIDPILTDVLSAGSIDELGIPTSPRMPDLQLLLDNITNGYHIALYCLLIGIALMALYFWSATKRNPIMYVAIIGIIIATFFAIRKASAGIVHIGNFCFSGIYNPYTGDLSDSWVYPFLTAIGCVALGLTAPSAFSKTKSILAANKWASSQKAETPPTTDAVAPTEQPTAAIPQQLTDSRQTKPCPYCGEEILAVAKKCKHCGEWLKEEVVEQTPQTAQLETAPSSSRHHKLWMLGGLALVVIVAVCISLSSSNDTSSPTDSNTDSLEGWSIAEEEGIEEVTEEVIDTLDAYTPVNVTESNKENSVRQFVTSMYRNVLPAMEDEDFDESLYVKRYFSDNLADWYHLVEDHDQKFHGGLGLLYDFNLWTQSQEPDMNIKSTIQSVRFDTDYMDDEYAVVSVMLKGRYNPPANIEIKLYGNPTDGWVVTDYNGMEMKLKSYLASHQH